MKTITLAVLVSFLLLSGLAMASQSGEQKRDPSMMEHMMKQGKGGEGSRGHMMRMMKMMDQCSAMMETSHSSEEPKERAFLRRSSERAELTAP